MNVTYQHANPRRGNESFLLRFDDGVHERSPCLLVDAGHGVDLDGLLGDDDYLGAVLLTHAHLDHYASLGRCVRDGAPVLAAPDTAAILGTVLDETARHRDLGDTAGVLDGLEPVDGWRAVTDDVRVHPTPAGHAPGAAGFVVEFVDTDPHHVFVTGDFTRRRAAGYPGFDPASLDDAVDVEAVFLTGATADDVERTLTDVCTTATERARAGSTVLLTAGGLTGVHLAYLLGHLGDAVDGPPVRLVGQAAKLYDQVGYDVPGVTTTPDFAAPTEVLADGCVTVAGPESPVGGSARALFEYVSGDGGATLLQVTSGATDPVTSAECTVYEFELSNHPTDATLNAVVETLEPVEVVVTHQSGRAANRFKDRYESFVWATDDEGTYTLYAGGWQAPPWVGDHTKQRVMAARGVGPRLDAPDDLPLPVRVADPDLAAEGLDVTALTERFARSAGDPAGATTADRRRTPSPADAKQSPGAGALPDERWAELDERLEAIERALAGRTVRARVIDGGDDLTLLRLRGAAALSLEPGEELDVVVKRDPPAPSADEGGAGRRRTAARHPDEEPEENRGGNEEKDDAGPSGGPSEAATDGGGD